MGTLEMVAEHVGGALSGANNTFDSVSTDTRTLAGGQLFFALRGERFDAAKFVAEAEAKGAAGAVVEARSESPLSQILVDDSRRALGVFAREWRQRFSIPIVAVTGSNGKTTTKEMIAAVLQAQWPAAADGDDTILATMGNLNNEIGLPLTVLRMRDHHSAAVLEMGASHPGDIAQLVEIGVPTVGVITNAAPAHIEGFGSLEKVAETKGELIRGLRPDAIAVLNRDDAFY
ncbi:MAG: UDP-N-acetylmuramoyl-tripeptide--D-alanyl-D-alanine ligase, partial [Gammaproteobacteria bacterium]